MIAGSHDKNILRYFKKLENCLPKCLNHFAFSPAMNESSCWLTSSLAFGVVSVLDLDHPNDVQWYLTSV